MGLIDSTDLERVASYCFAEVGPSFKQVILWKVREYYRASSMVSKVKKRLGEAPGRGLKGLRYTL